MRSMMIIRFDFDIRFNGIAFRINKSFFLNVEMCSYGFEMLIVNKKKFQSIKTFSQNYDYTVIFIKKNQVYESFFFFKIQWPFL